MADEETVSQSALNAQLTKGPDRVTSKELVEKQRACSLGLPLRREEHGMQRARRRASRASVQRQRGPVHETSPELLRTEETPSP